MSKNKDLWKRAFTTDPRHVKPITGKQYSGNSPKPYWIVERLTDEFGPCGIGWGFTILNERFERFSDTDTLHVASVRFWYVLDGQRGELEQIGQTKASYTTSKGSFMLDEDAPKKSVTDALVKCASYLGFAGDIFSGRWDDSKYVAEAAKEWKEREQEGKPEPEKKPEPKQPAPKVPAKVEGEPGRWQITIKAKPDATPTDWVNLISEAAIVCLEQAKSRDDCMKIYQVNHSLFVKLKSLDAECHKDLLAAFTAKKLSFPETSTSV
jgi:hypothetical protein